MKLTDPQFYKIRDHIYKVSGIDINVEKHYLVQQRLEPVARTFGLKDFDEFIKKLMAPGEAYFKDTAIQAITTNETSFFRDNHPFDTFRDHILPALAEIAVHRKTASFGRKGSKIDIWCAASSTGQEPYTLAMTIYEYAIANRSKGLLPEDFSILATDISSDVLAKAMSGEYTDLEVSRGLSPERKTKYFRKNGNSWALDSKILSMVEFRKINLSESFLMLGGFDVIFCRNVLIYFSDKVKTKIVDQFRRMLSDPGFLFLGACESLNTISSEFESSKHKQTLYYTPKKGK